MFSIYFYINFLIGSCLASHALVIYDRWPEQDFVFTRSKCFNCHYQLSLLDEIPILSYLLLKGRCRYCHHPISAESFFFELIGGFLFCTNNFTNLKGITNIVFLFSILLISIYDYYQNSFDLLFIFPPFLIAILYNQYIHFTFNDWISFLTILIVLFWNVFKQKMGLGDLLIYFLISSLYTPFFANLTLLFAAIILIGHYSIEHRNKNYHYPFIPYIVLGLIITQLLMY